MNRTLWLPDHHLEALVAYARAGVPNEVCGILAGHGGAVQRVIPVENTAADPRHHYTLDARALSRHLPALEREGLDLIGFYHSHPDSDPIPSVTDIALAAYPDSVYLIISLKSAVPRVAAWHIYRGRVDSVELHRGTNPPQAASDRAPLSPVERAAVFVTVLLAFALLIVVSLVLLPPAPILSP